MVGLMMFMMLSTFGLIMFIVFVARQGPMHDMRSIEAPPPPPPAPPQLEEEPQEELTPAELSDKWTIETAELYSRSAAASPESALREAQRLHEAGLITDDDYAALRRKILGL